jgi:hypothetical protein
MTAVSGSSVSFIIIDSELVGGPIRAVMPHRSFFANCFHVVDSQVAATFVFSVAESGAPMFAIRVGSVAMMVR